MNIIEIAKKVNKSWDNECWADIPNLGNQFGLCLDNVEQNRLKGYWFGSWYCTDTVVGYKMYFLDEEPIAFSVQEGRKQDEKFYWLSKELALKTKEYLVSLLMDIELDINICDVDDEIGDGYKIDFNSQILEYNKPMLKGEDVSILERIRNKNNYGIDHELKIRLKNGNEKVIDISELDFRYYID